MSYKKHTIKINHEAKPVINRARLIPLRMIDKAKIELDEVEANEINAKVDQPTDWASSIAVVRKRDGSVRICLDHKEHHHISTLEDISFRFTGTSGFTIVDMKAGYWHTLLDHQSQLLTTLGTPFGRHC